MFIHFIFSSIFKTTRHVSRTRNMKKIFFSFSSLAQPPLRVESAVLEHQQQRRMISSLDAYKCVCELRQSPRERARKSEKSKFHFVKISQFSANICTVRTHIIREFRVYFSSLFHFFYFLFHRVEISYISLLHNHPHSSPRCKVTLVSPTRARFQPKFSSTSNTIFRATFSIFIFVAKFKFPPCDIVVNVRKFSGTIIITRLRERFTDRLKTGFTHPRADREKNISKNFK